MIHETDMAGGTRRSKSSSKLEQENEEEDALYNFQQVKDFLKVQESTIKSFFTVIVESTNSRIDSILKEVQTIKASLEHTQADLADLKELNCQDRLQSLEENLGSLIDKTDDLENRSRRNNLCFEGIEEKYGNETWEESEQKIKGLISTTLKINTDDMIIERAHRVGKKKSTAEKPRPIVAKFLNFKDRDMVIKERRKLKGTKHVIREDFSDRVLEKRKSLLPKMNEARKEGKIAYLSYDKLIIKQSRYHGQPSWSLPGHHANQRTYEGPPFANPGGFIPQPMFIPMAPTNLVLSQDEHNETSNEEHGEE